MVDVVPGTKNKAIREVVDGLEYFTPIVSTEGGGGGAAQVEVTNFPPTQPVSGPLTGAQLTAVTGTAAQTTVATDPAAAGLTELALLRGILAELKAQTTVLQTIATNTTPTP
ncbi:hypothetical protein [Achromobacter marplatensis]|uniref:hypothetical protein n=1 Tax=Achromobacter marplatensis TaxID=470868 RepID=UPI0028EC1AF3|nr:hypothetical protein [Achromobacter marplatensis]